MVTYNCKRCGYTTNLRGNIKGIFEEENLQSSCRAM